MEKPLVSIIITAHNYGHFIGEAIESCLSQTYSPIEVIVVDDDSIDNTTAEVTKYRNVIYHYIKHKGNATPARASNIGLKISHGAFIIFLGADDILDSTYVARCLKRFGDDKKTAFVWTATQEFGLKHNLRIPITKSLHHRYSAFLNPSGQLGAMLVSRSVYDDVGGYDETLHGLEDWDWVIRACLKGYHGSSIPDALHFQRVHKSNLTHTVHSQNLDAEIYAKYPSMRSYVFVRRSLTRLMMFLSNPGKAAILLRNKIVRRFLHYDKFMVTPTNIQHSAVNEKTILEEIHKVGGRRVLDCACGIGRWGYLLGKDYQVIGVDLIKEYLISAKNLNCYDGLVLADISHLPFVSHSFDLALAVEAIEHLPKDVGKRFLFELRRLTKWLILTTPKEFWETRYRNFMYANPEAHVSFWTKQEILDLLHQ